MSDVMRRFPRELTAAEKSRIFTLKAVGETFIEQLQPDCREFEIARTKMEEAIMWAVKGITR